MVLSARWSRVYVLFYKITIPVNQLKYLTDSFRLASVYRSFPDRRITEGRKMNKYIAVLLLFFSNLASSQEYLLEITEECHADGIKLNFKCGLSIEERITGKKARFIIFKFDDLWQAKQTNGLIVAKFKTLRDDDNILILETTTIFSGNRVFHIFKKNQRFYLIETAYTDTLENKEVTLTQGKFKVLNE